MTGNDEPTMNTVAAIAYLMEPEMQERWRSVLNVWTRDDFGRWLKIFCIDSGKMSMENAHNCVDWGLVVDALFLNYVDELDRLEKMEGVVDSE